MIGSTLILNLDRLSSVVTDGGRQFHIVPVRYNNKYEITMPWLLNTSLFGRRVPFVICTLICSRKFI